MSEKEKLQLENECLLKYSKAQMIQKYIDELEENCTLSDLWCKSQEKIKEVREYIEHENFKRTVLVGVSTKKYTRDILNNILEILGREKNDK